MHTIADLPDEEPLFMTWEEYLAFEEQSPYRHEYVNGAGYSMSGASLAHNEIAQELVVEILSKSTQHIDRREKAMTYQRVESIEEYVLIAQNQPRVIVHRRAEGWRPVLYSSMDARVEFRCIGLAIPLERLYIRDSSDRCPDATCGPAPGER